MSNTVLTVGQFGIPVYEEREPAGAWLSYQTKSTFTQVFQIFLEKSFYS